MIGAQARKWNEAANNADAVLEEVLNGLSQTPKRLPCKLFYDTRGSALFERICDLDEYYLTRTELGILRSHIDEIAHRIGSGRILVEYGSGASIKTRLLLDKLEAVTAYIPIDICQSALHASKLALTKAYPNLPIAPVCGDYTGPLDLPLVTPTSRVAGFFPGSTIGNLDAAAAKDFLRGVRAHCGAAGKLLLGVDLQKDEPTLLAAYDDTEGVTAQFNLNILRVLNREHNANFRAEEFTHSAIWNSEAGRVEMHLVSKCRQNARVDSQVVRLDAGEHIVTEHCYKYQLPQFRDLCEKSGLSVERVWTDPKQLFSVHLLKFA
jgi:dimethylhistidine N-methyltransferase